MPDLAAVLGSVRISPTNVESEATITADGEEAARVAAVRISSLMSVDILDQRLIVEHPANNRLNFRIDEFTNHLNYSKEFVCICEQHWLEANQCLTARVYRRRRIFYL